MATEPSREPVPAPDAPAGTPEAAPRGPLAGVLRFSIRQRWLVLMGTLGTKLWRARLMRHFGPELILKLRAGGQTPAPLISSPGVDFTALPDPADSLTGAELVSGLLPRPRGAP